MSQKLVAAMAFVLILTATGPTRAQLVVGTPEDKAYQQIQAEKNADKKTQLLLGFEKDFPQSPVLIDIELSLMGIYQQKNDSAKTIDYGEKAIKLDNQNIAALMAVAREYAVQKKNLDRALTFAQRAVDDAVKQKSQPAPAGYGAEQWKQYVDSTETSARNILAYVKSVK
jgi:tetratricopeptide (TPR) repeat protein